MITISRRWILSFILVLATVTILLHVSGNAQTPLTVPTPPESLIPQLPPNFSWKGLARNYPVESTIPLPSGPLASIPRIQHKPTKETAVQKYIREKRLTAVKNSFKHSWEGYKKNAWLQDEACKLRLQAPVTGSSGATGAASMFFLLSDNVPDGSFVRPLSGGYKNGFGGWGATLVDSLDTLWIMSMKKDFNIALDALKHLDFTVSSSRSISVFETTIRYVGGLLSAYDLTGEAYPILLEKATELGDMLYAAFDTPNNMPLVGHWNWVAASRGDKQQAPMSALSADIGSLSLEFTRLSQLTGDPKYYDAIQRIFNLFENHQNSTKLPGMWPVSLDALHEDFSKDRTFTLGAMADSWYEYLPKQYLLIGGRDKQCQVMYEKALSVAKEHLFYRALNPKNQRLLISGTTRRVGASYQLNAEGQHLTCFVGGMVGLGARIFDAPEELETATQLTDGCVWAYDSMPSGIMPEIFTAIPCEDGEGCEWSDEKWYQGVKSAHSTPSTELSLEDYAKEIIESRKLVPGIADVIDSRYYLRPEAIESVFYMYRITGDRAWQDKAWRMFQAIETHARTDIAYAVIKDVRDEKSQLTDTMESFWTGETLKYFFLIFSDPGVVSLDDYVYNTEAHPLRRPQS